MEQSVATAVAICSVCSREKDPNEELLPATQRYKGTHVSTVAHAAAQVGVPFYILSGKYGLIPGDREIPYYDLLLGSDHVEELSQMIVWQLKEYGHKRLYFYMKNKPHWKPYREALQQAARVVGVDLLIHELSEDM